MTEEGGLVCLPVPLSTPGFDSTPTLAATNVITKNPDTGSQNMGTYRAGLKSSDRLVVRMATRVGGAEGFMHWKTHKERGEKLPCAIVVGCPPYVAFMGPQKLPIGREELPVQASRLSFAHVQLIFWCRQRLSCYRRLSIRRCSDGRSWQSHGHVALEELNLPMKVTALLAADAVIPSIFSGVRLVPS